MKIAVRGVTGIVPKTAPELLPANAATVARDCYLLNGNVAPLNNAELFAAVKTIGAETIYRMVDAPDPNIPAFLEWNIPVDVVGIPFGTTFRYSFTGPGIVPQATTYSMATSGAASGQAFPIASRPLGLPMPVHTPTVAPAAVTSSGTTSGTPVVRSYTYTWLTDWEEESMPAVASTPMTGDYNGTWLIAMDAPPTSFNGLPLAPIRRRLYRTEGTSAQFQLVAEEPAVGAWSNNQFADDLLNTADTSNPGILGDAMVSADWDAPPSDMLGACLHPSGMLMGFAGNIVYVSEQFQPHAYPPQYQLKTEYPVVGIGVAGTSVVVLTTVYPYLVIGTTPGQMYLQRAGEPLPCLSKRSIVAMGTAVLYASTYGYVSIDINNGVSILTQQVFDYREWQAREPETMIAFYAEGRIHIYSPNLISDNWLMINVRDNVVTTVSQTATAFHADNLTGLPLFVNGQNAYSFDPTGGTPGSFTWTSKEFVLPHPLNFGAARILFTPAATSPNLVFTLFTGNGDQRLQYTVQSEKPFRLPAGFMNSRWQFTISGNATVKSVELAETVGNLDAISQLDMMNTAQ